MIVRHACAQGTLIRGFQRSLNEKIHMKPVYKLLLGLTRGTEGPCLSLDTAQSSLGMEQRRVRGPPSSRNIVREVSHIQTLTAHDQKI